MPPALRVNCALCVCCQDVSSGSVCAECSFVAFSSRRLSRALIEGRERLVRRFVELTGAWRGVAVDVGVGGGLDRRGWVGAFDGAVLSGCGGDVSGVPGRCRVCHEDNLVTAEARSSRCSMFVVLSKCPLMPLCAG